MSFINNEWFIVNDLEGFVNSTRALVYNNFGRWNKTSDNSEIDDMIVSPSDKKEFDRILSKEESEVIIKQHLRKQKHKTSSKIRYLVSDNLFLGIVKDLNDRLVSNILTGLVNRGLVESAYDSEINDFVFWIKDENKNEENPETD